jgi:hypothetical protein
MSLVMSLVTSSSRSMIVPALSFARAGCNATSRTQVPPEEVMQVRAADDYSARSLPGRGHVAVAEREHAGREPRAVPVASASSFSYRTDERSAFVRRAGTDAEQTHPLDARANCFGCQYSDTGTHSDTGTLLLIAACASCCRRLKRMRVDAASY